MHCHRIFCHRIFDGGEWGADVEELIFALSPYIYESEVMQLLTIKWGKVTSVLTIEDTQRFVNIPPLLAAAGIEEANALRIED